MKWFKKIFSKKKKQAGEVEERIDCYIKLNVDNTGQVSIDWGWGEDPKCIQEFSELLMRFNNGVMLKEIVTVVQEQCILGGRTDLYKQFVYHMTTLYDHNIEKEQTYVDQMIKEVDEKKSSPLIRPTQVMAHD